MWLSVVIAARACAPAVAMAGMRTRELAGLTKRGNRMAVCMPFILVCLLSRPVTGLTAVENLLTPHNIEP